MPSARSVVDSFLSLFRPRQPVIPEDLDKRPELSLADYQSRRETYPLYPLAGWSPVRIIQMLEDHDVGNFQLSELFYHALRKEGLISAALAMRKEVALEYSSTLQCPKDAPDEVHTFVEALIRDWQSVIPDDVRGEIIERTNVFGFMVCRIQWTYRDGQRQPRLIPFTHSSLSYRQDLYCYQGLTERGLETITNDGREWCVFTLGGTRPWLAALLRPLGFTYFGIVTGDDRWLNFNDKFSEPLKVRYMPRLTRESVEAQKLRDKDDMLRGGDVVLCPRESKDTGYDFRYEQINAQGYETLKEQLNRFDERAAIIILGHNLLQMVKGGSLAAMKEAKGLLRTKSVADCKLVSTGVEPLSKVWARANFGTDPNDFPELNGRLVESVSWSLVYDTADPVELQAKALRASQFAQAFATFAKAAGPKIMELPIDWIEAAERCGIPMLSGEDSYSQEDDDETDLDGDPLIRPPSFVVAAARRALGWVHDFKRGGTGPGRQMATRIIRGSLRRADVLKMAGYFAKHEGEIGGSGWDNLKRPSTARIAWGLWGDSGDGRGRAWAEKEAGKAQAFDGSPSLPMLPAA